MKKLLLTALSFTMGLAAVAQAPKADVLDIIFNDDGTVVDASAMANPLKVLGDPVIKRSPQYGMNVLCNEQELWGEQSYNNIRVPYNDNLLEAVPERSPCPDLRIPHCRWNWEVSVRQYNPRL